MKQVLIINVTRMGDLVQTGVLVQRLHEESPGVAVDLVVDRSFASMAALLNGVRQVITYDFQGLLDDSRSRLTDVVTLHAHVAAWVNALAGTGYDRVVNLTFTRRSAWLVSALGVRDVRGVIMGPDGVLTVRNPWMGYFTDLHRVRAFNRFNLVDVYALGGSGPGRPAHLQLPVAPGSRKWARAQLNNVRGAMYEVQNPEAARRTSHVAPQFWMAVQAGASDVMKAWRPEYYGQVLALLRRRLPIGFVMIGAASEEPVVQEALGVYRKLSGPAAENTVCNLAGRTDLNQLLAILAECRLLLTNDTGPMHMAVSVGTPVVDLSVGHVDFRETGPYGPGHWVVQPDLDCSPCGFDMICPHHACKDRLVAETIAELCVHALGRGALPGCTAGMRIYASGFDEDGLGSFRPAAGREDARTDWYGRFWRRYWYRHHTGCESRSPAPEDQAPDAAVTAAIHARLEPLSRRLLARAGALVRLARRHPGPAAQLKATQQAIETDTREIIRLVQDVPAFWPLTVVLLREKQNMEAVQLAAMAQEQALTYARWAGRVREVADLIIDKSAQHSAISVQRRMSCV
jgi:ADP-heptose:LPS heptosyltransferase